MLLYVLNNLHFLNEIFSKKLLISIFPIIFQAEDFIRSRVYAFLQAIADILNFVPAENNSRDALRRRKRQEVCNTYIYEI